MQSSNKGGQEAMKRQTLGTMIATLRKENGMTQLELAEKMGVAVVVLSAMGSLDANTGITMLGVGPTCFGTTMIGEKK